MLNSSDLRRATLISIGTLLYLLLASSTSLAQTSISTSDYAVVETDETGSTYVIQWAEIDAEWDYPDVYETTYRTVCMSLTDPTGTQTLYAGFSSDMTCSDGVATASWSVGYFLFMPWSVPGNYTAVITYGIGSTDPPPTWYPMTIATYFDFNDLFQQSALSGVATSVTDDGDGTYSIGFSQDDWDDLYAGFQSSGSCVCSDIGPALAQEYDTLISVYHGVTVVLLQKLALVFRNPTPVRGPPNSIAVHNTPGGRVVRVYGPDGKATHDVDYGDQTHGPWDPEVHEWDWSQGKPARLAPRPPAPGDIPPGQPTHLALVPWQKSLVQTVFHYKSKGSGLTRP